MNPVRLTCAALLLVAPLLAQTPAPAARLHIPAGTWSVRDLLTQAEQALRTPIVAEPAELALGSATAVRLQNDLVLDPEHGREAIAALLATRGLLLTRDAAGRTEVKAAPRGKPDWLRERAVPTTVAELLEHPFRNGVVRVELATTASADMLTNLLRVAAATGNPTPTCEAAGKGIACTGTSEAVRLAVTQLAAIDPQFAAVLQPPPPVSIVGNAKLRAVELTAGEHPITDLVDLLAANVGINVVLAPAVAAATKTVVVEKPLQLGLQNGPIALTTLLWQQRVLFLELDVRHGLYEVVLVDDPRQVPAVGRASRRTVDEALAAADCVMFVAVPFAARHLDNAQIMAHLRAAMGNANPKDGGFLSALGTENGVLITGLSPQVAALLRELQTADQPRRG